MKKVRIGKDFRVLWKVTINGEPVTEMYRSLLSLIMVDPRFNMKELDFYIYDGKVCATITNTMQKYLGTHKLSLWYKGEDGVKSAIDEIEAYSLVKYSTEENWGFEGDIDTDIDIEMSEGNLLVTAKGESAYEIWLKNGYSGTEEDFLNWMKDISYTDTGKNYKDIV